MAAVRSALQFLEGIWGLNQSKDKGNAPMKLTVEDKDVIVTVKVVGKPKPRLFSSVPKLFKTKKKEGNATSGEAYKYPASFQRAPPVPPRQDVLNGSKAANYRSLKLKPEVPPRRQRLTADRQPGQCYRNQSLDSHTHSSQSPDQLDTNHNTTDPETLDSFEVEMNTAYINLPGEGGQLRGTAIAPRGEAIPKSIGGADDPSDIYGDGVGVTRERTITNTLSRMSSSSNHSYLEPLETRPVSGVMYTNNDGETAWIMVMGPKGREVCFTAGLREKGPHF